MSHRKVISHAVEFLVELMFSTPSAHFEEDGAPLWRQNSFGLRQQPETMLLMLFNNSKEDMVPNFI